MKRDRSLFTAILTLIVATVFLLTETSSAQAQSLRYLNRSVEAGKQIEFQWLNYDERTCTDRGYPKLVIEDAPSLGKFRTVQRKFTPQNGACKGKRFSVLLVYYVAGRKTGQDSTTYVIQGRTNIRINLSIDVT
ncbi:hypothetical protein [Marivita sp.]|jgi:hypothetical protein|uniref:hypothetical protein n=1 Tax=Marivita sp. TaxID=2003365 RepID=UPI003F6C6E46